MKKVFAILSIVAIFNFGSTLNVVAQDSTATEQVAAIDSAVAVTDTTGYRGSGSSSSRRRWYA